MTQPPLQGDHVRLRLLAEEDLPRLLEILLQPGVAEWWPGYEMARLRADTFGSPDTTSLAIELDGRIVGLVIYAEETDPYYKSAGIDITLDNEHLGQGLGSDTLRTLARHLFEERGHHRLTIGPALATERAIGGVQEGGFQAGRDHAPVRDGRRRHLSRQPAHGHARWRTCARIEVANSRR